MKVKDLIEKLQKVDPELDVILEPHIDCMDADYTPYRPWDVLMGLISPITFRYSQVESNRETETDDWNESWVQCDYDWIKDSIDKRKVLVLSSSEFKYGTTEEKESKEFK